MILRRLIVSPSYDGDHYTTNTSLYIYIYIYIYIYTNLKIVIFLYVMLNLRKGIFEIYKKENDTSTYIHTSLNHPPSIIKQIPKSVSRRLSDNSSNIEIFNKCKHIYDKALKYSGYRQTLEYTPPKS